MSNKGFFVVSLDFELYWGMFDKVTLEHYGENIKGVHTTIPEILSLFEQYDIHATWATVGMLMSANKFELLSLLPPETLRPVYGDMSVSSYTHINEETLGTNATDDPYHYGSALVEQIIETPNQELGSHTFSHYYCLDGSENDEAIFAADCEAFKKVASHFNTPVTSIVFPRNQTTQDALATCKEYGITAYRGTPSHFLYTGKKEVAQTNIFLRALRIIDAYINISGHHTYTLARTKEEGLANVAGSFFFRPFNKSLRIFEKMRINRIKKSMTYAAKHNEIFHLWWHPHNMGINRQENLYNLLQILAHYQYLKETYGMQSANMHEITNISLE
jgi:peptidoglycan/xylan/chitin deacetylase (PgdA/CDA1 family)